MGVVSTVQMPTPPEGHYWRIKQSALSGHRRLYLMRQLRWWFTDLAVDWTTIGMSADEHKNARETVRLANFLLEVWREERAGFNGLTGYVDHKGVAR